MEISIVRDYVISIVGILYIIITIAAIVGLLFVYLKLRGLINSINKTIRTIRRWLAYINGLLKGLNESLELFRKGGASHGH